ncbi:hypothetical protein B0H34DRAFT_212513 [Crassisporium funariophilum]|nr:hypothetical protein B0H34DRAFT_212513 [Crassisporium funariophilum]
MGQYDHILGPLVIAVFVNTYLSGFVGFHYAAYVTTKFNDPLYTKLAVLTLCLVDAFQGILAIYMTWLYCVTFYTDPTGMEYAELWTYTVIPICNAISGIIAHVFFGHKILKLTGGKITFTTVLILSYASAGLGLATGIWAIIQRLSMVDILSGSSPHRSLMVSWLATQGCLDILITASTVYAYSHRRSPFLTHLSGANRTFRYAIQTGAIGAAFSFLSLVTFLVSPKTNVYIVFVLTLGRLYSNSVLDTLLARDNRAALLVSINSQANSRRGSKDLWQVTNASQADQTRNFNRVHVKTELQVFVDGPETDDLEKRGDDSRDECEMDMDRKDHRLPVQKISLSDSRSIESGPRCL